MGNTVRTGDRGDPQVDDTAAGGASIELGELLLCSGEADVEPLDLAQPALVLASAMRAVRLSRISTSRSRCAGSGQSIGQRTPR